MELSRMVKDLSGLLTTDQVSAAVQDIAEFGTNALLRVYPADAAQLSRVIRWAGETGAKLVPVSSGPPHLHGASSPAVPAVMLDLSRMRNILRIDRRNRAVMVESGVRFGDLVPALRREGLRLPMPLYPRSGKSVLAAYLEREPTTLPKYQWDYMDPLCCLELVFGDGHLFRTGTAAGPGTLEQQWASGDAQKSNMGPAQADFGRLVQGAQGTLGVATWASLRLELWPAIHRLYFIGADSPQELTEAQHWLQRLRLADELFVVNRVFLSHLWTGAEEAPARDLPSWVLAFALSGSGPLAEKQFRYRRADVRDLAARLGCRVEESLGSLAGGRLLEILYRACPATWWKHRPKGGCREIFFTSTYDRTPGFVTLVEEACKTAGHPVDEVGIYVQPLLGGRSCHVEFDLYFNPADCTESDRVKGIDAALQSVLPQQQAFFSRPYGLWAATVWGRDPITWEALKKVKSIFDPAGVLNPGQMGL